MDAAPGPRVPPRPPAVGVRRDRPRPLGRPRAGDHPRDPRLRAGRGRRAPRVLGRPALSVPDDRAPLVIVYLVDTLRADHTTPYGYARDTTPELTTFAQDAVVFEAAIAHASWTKPSIASIFTSRSRAGTARCSSATPGPRPRHAGRDAAGPGVLHRRGHRELGHLLRGVELRAGLRLLRGPARRRRPALQAGGGRGRGGRGAALARRRAAASPRFLYLHTMDPHVPYAPPPPFDRKFEPHPVGGQPAADPRIDYKEPLDRDRLDRPVRRRHRVRRPGVRPLPAGAEGPRPLRPRAHRVHRPTTARSSRTTAKWLHGRSVFDELIRVPLMVKFPGRRATRAGG